MTGIPFRDTIAAKGSELYAALVEGNLKKANQIYNATTERMYALVKKKEPEFEDVPF